MKTHTHRVAMMISNEHCNPNGGVGASTQSLTQMFQQQGCQVDLIVDQQAKDTVRQAFLGEFTQSGCGIFTPNAEQDYKNTKEIHAFREGPNWQQVHNFKMSLFRALHYTVYDLVICHNAMAALAIQSMDLPELINTVIYTHDYNAVFRDKTPSFMYMPSMTEINSIAYGFRHFTVGTQTERNRRELAHLDNCTHLPLPLTTPSLLTEQCDTKRGVLFIGRWEPRKNPKQYVDVIERTALPARIITNRPGEAAFRREFEKRHITDVEYVSQHTSKLGYTPQAVKARFIAQCKVAFLPYKWESYGLTVDEARCQMPVVLMRENKWHLNFQAHNTLYLAESTQDAADITTRLHAQPNRTDRDLVAQQQHTIWPKWQRLLAKRETMSSVLNRASQQEAMWHTEYVSALKRKMGIEDIHSLVKARQTLTHTHYTARDAWYSTGQEPRQQQTEEIDIRSWAKGL